jgi:hypothetical protein
MRIDHDLKSKISIKMQQQHSSHFYVDIIGQKCYFFRADVHKRAKE